MIKLNSELREKLLLYYIPNLLALIIIALAIYTSISMLLIDRSLWLDEAMLAKPISIRSLTELTSTPLEWNQSAPVIYIYIVKIITLIFGNNEFALRLWATLSYILTLGASFYILKYIFSVKYPLLGIAFISNLPILLGYSCEFKPYMSDCFFVLLVLIIYDLYSKRKINYYWFLITLMILVWVSNPSCFFIGSILIYDFINSIIEKDYSRTRKAVIAGILTGLSFIAYFFYWLKPVLDTGYMQSFWGYMNFPLIPTSRIDLWHQKRLITGLIEHLGIFQYLIASIITLGFFINLFKFRNKYLSIIFLSVFICAFASMLGKLPMQDRLWLFIYPVLCILFFTIMDKLFSKNNINNLIVLTISFVIILSANGIFQFRDKDKMYRNYQETNLAIEYIDNHIKNGEKLYIFFHGVPGFLYKNGYNENSIGNIDNNVILGPDFTPGTKTAFDEAKKIRDNAPIYILAPHVSSIENQDLFKELEKEGKLELIYDKYKTPVYYYQRSTVDTLISAPNPYK